LPAAARFCPTCGRPVEPEFGPAAPPATPPIWAGLRLPGWLTSDWPLAGLGVAVLLVLLFAASALYGTVAAVAASGRLRAAPYGGALGSHLAFAAFGARVAVSFGEKNGSNLVLQFLPLPWAVAGGLAMRAALRFARPRLPDDRRRRTAYAAKVAVAGGIVLGIVAGLLDQGSEPGSGFRSHVNGGEVWFYTTVLLLGWGWLWLRRDGQRTGPALPADLRPLAPRAAEGALAFVALAVVFAFAGLVFALAVVDSNGAQVGLLFGVPVAGLNFGAAIADVAMGAAVGLGSVFAQPAGHLSLVHFGLPPAADAGAAPAWLFVVMLAAPAAVGFTVWRRLEHLRPEQEQEALGIGAATAAGFAAMAWLLALVGRIVLLAAIAPPGALGRSASPLALLRGRGPGVGTFVSAQPNPVSVFFLALFWALIGGLGAAFLWASRHHARWQLSPGGEPGPAPAPPAPEPPASPPAAPAPVGPEPAPSAPPTDAWLLPVEPSSPGGAGGDGRTEASEGEAGQEAGAAGEEPEEKP